jgi:hypothetical protein
MVDVRVVETSMEPGPTSSVATGKSSSQTARSSGNGTCPSAVPLPIIAAARGAVELTPTLRAGTDPIR